MARIFCLWSGGLDSTYLIQHLLDKGHSVSAAHVKIKNNTEQMKREQQARTKIAEIFNDRYKGKFDYYGEAYQFDITLINQKVPLKQAFVWLMAYLSLPNHSYSSIEQMAIGYVMNDDAISYLDELKACWASFNILADDKVELVFPIMKKKKQDCWNELSYEIRELCTWCEGSQEKDHCGECHSCKRFALDLPYVFEDLRKNINQIADECREPLQESFTAYGF
jgi:7-cyano-7-deazaguanine synthase in queuosine biosynthesis